MNYDTLRILIDHFETFERETGQQDMAAFSAWLQHKYSPPSGKKEVAPYNRYGDYNGQIAHAVGVLWQHARHYIKTALEDLPLKGLHDFTFLAGLAELGEQRKSQLIAMNMLDYSPGMEVIRRLLRHDLIEDFDDPEDARSKRVRITKKGRAVFGQALQRMMQATYIVGGNLSEKEKIQFLAVAKKLLHFHRSIWEEDLGAPLEDITDKYLPEKKEE